MVVGRVMRWSPPVERKKRYQVRVRVTRLEGLPPLGGRLVAVGIRWKGPPRAGGLSYLRRRTKQVRSVSRETPVGAGGVAEWAAEEEEDEFENVCCFCCSDTDSSPNCFLPWEVSFSVLHGFQYEQEVGKEKKLAEIGTTSINLADWVWTSKSQKQAEGKESQLSVQRKQIPITLQKDYSATLYVNVSFVEVRTFDETTETPAKIDEPITVRKGGKQDEETIIDHSCTFGSEILDLTQLLQLADEADKLVSYNGRNRATTSSTTTSTSSGGSSPDSQLGSVPKHRFLSWGKRRKNVNKSNDDTEDGNRKDDSNTNMDPIGSWENKEFISRDRQAKLKAQTFFASIDQRDESAGGESACTALVAVIADTLHSNGANMPTRSKFDALIREGSLEWRKLCDNASYIDRFPNKHFDLDTVLEAKIRPISINPEKSFIGFFQPESFKSLGGAMSFEDIWDEISRNAGKGNPKVYIVSWNDHFFLLKVEPDAYYVIDTLGERLFEGCNKAYVLRFDDSTEMYRLPDNSGNVNKGELICSGKECCREFLKKFLAAIPLREELEIEEKGKGTTNIALHQRLQIEFHHTEASS